MHAIHTDTHARTHARDTPNTQYIARSANHIESETKSIIVIIIIIIIIMIMEIMPELGQVDKTRKVLAVKKFATTVASQPQQHDREEKSEWELRVK